MANSSMLSKLRPARGLGLALALLVAAGVATPQPAKAQAFPSRPITLIIPFPPGGMIAQAIAAIENGCIDIKAKALGVPAYELFGGSLRDRLPVYWSQCGTLRVRFPGLFDAPAVLTLDDEPRRREGQPGADPGQFLGRFRSVEIQASEVECAA